ncbi:hypothetical protein [Streptomyces sp. NBC_00454]|uniref:hypothetical protein n=1 Tax=Streptomyces sp. NBC_00454 TaxID=2975747 RepID=UPI0030E0008B
MTPPLPWPWPGRGTGPGATTPDAPRRPAAACGAAAVGRAAAPAVAWGPGPASFCAGPGALRSRPPASARTPGPAVSGTGAQAPASRLRPGVWGLAPAFGKGRGGGDAPPAAGATAPHTTTRTAEETYP